MATETLETLIKMRDELSKPLSDQQRALKKLTEQIRTLQKATTTADREQKKHLELTKQQRKNTLDLIPGVSKLTGNMEKFGGGMGLAVTAAGATVIAVAAVIAGVVALGAALVYTTAKILEITSAEADWATKTRSMFAVMDQKGGSGATQLKIVTDLAKSKGVALQSIAATAQDLLDSGVRNQRELQQSLDAVTDLQAAGSEKTADHLKDLIKRAASARGGFAGQDTWAGTTMFSAVELQKAGTNVKDFYKELSAIKGKPVSQWQVATGQIRASSKEMIKALTQAVSKRVGPIAEKAWTLDRIKNSWAATWQDMTKNIDFGPLYKELRGLMAVFDPLSKSGDSTSKTLTRVVNAIVKGVAWMVKKVTILILDLEIAFLKAVIAINPIWNKMAKFIKDNSETVKGALLGIAVLLAGIIITVLLLAAAFAVLWAIAFLPVLIVVGAFILLGIAIQRVISHFKEWKTAALDAAASLVDGLASGLRKGVVTVTDAAKQLGTAAITSLKAVLGIKSPSKVFEQAGMFSGMGFERGLTRSMKGIDVGMPGVSMSGGGSRAGAIHLGGLQININGIEKAEQVIPASLDTFADWLERIMLEYGH
jgi:hypothetical protein